jgi:hypothetical protein
MHSIYHVLFIAFVLSCHTKPKPRFQAKEVINRIQVASGIEWEEKTVDTYKGGNAQMEIPWE